MNSLTLKEVWEFTELRQTILRLLTFMPGLGSIGNLLRSCRFFRSYTHACVLPVLGNGFIVPNDAIANASLLGLLPHVLEHSPSRSYSVSVDEDGNHLISVVTEVGHDTVQVITMHAADSTVVSRVKIHAEVSRFPFTALLLHRGFTVRGGATVRGGITLGLCDRTLYIRQKEESAGEISLPYRGHSIEILEVGLRTFLAVYLSTGPDTFGMQLVYCTGDAAKWTYLDYLHHLRNFRVIGDRLVADTHPIGDDPRFVNWDPSTMPEDATGFLSEDEELDWQQYEYSALLEGTEYFWVIHDLHLFCKTGSRFNTLNLRTGRASVGLDIPGGVGEMRISPCLKWKEMVILGRDKKLSVYRLYCTTDEDAYTVVPSRKIVPQIPPIELGDSLGPFSYFGKIPSNFLMLLPNTSVDDNGDIRRDADGQRVKDIYGVPIANIGRYVLYLNTAMYVARFGAVVKLRKGSDSFSEDMGEED